MITNLFRLKFFFIFTISIFVFLIYYFLHTTRVFSISNKNSRGDSPNEFLRIYDDFQMYPNNAEVKQTSVPAVKSNNNDNCTLAFVQQQWRRGKLEWQPTDATTDTLVISAHLDTRNPANDIVVIIGVARNYASRSANEHYCYVYKTEKEPPLIFPATFKYVPETHGREYAASIHECILTGLGRYRPFGVSLVKERCKKPLNQLIFTNHTSSYKVNFTVCYGPLHSNYDNYKQLIETTELNLMFGAQHFFFYDTESHPSIAPYIDKYISEGLATRIDWKLSFVNKIHLYAQLAAINDCLYRNMDRSRFIVFSDLDEVIVPRRDSNWLNMMARVSNNYKPYFPGVYSVQNTFFVPRSFEETPTDFKWLSLCPPHFDELVCSSIINDLEIISLRSLRRYSKIYPWDSRSKIIVWTKAVKMLGIHQLFEPIKNSLVKVVRVNSSDALLNHYRKITISEKESSVEDAYLAQTRWLEIFDRMKKRHAVFRNQST